MTNDMKVGNKSYHLRWNNHLANLRALFECMFNEQYLVDVTIVCQDGQLRAHNLILSACSPFFETIFQENPCRHPTVIMRDVTLKEMQSLCQYMYVGSVEVQESSLSSLLNVARDMQIKGLSEKTVYPIKNECTDGDSKFEMMTNDMKVGNKSYHLRWNNHLANLRALFECMFNEQYLVDVTIVCQDGQLRAHNLILSACSPFFETIFQENPCRHPTVIMRDVTLKEMQSLCQYMYVGSVEVQESSLSSLLNVARDLQIKGLSEKTVYPIKNECTDGDSKFEMMTNDMKVGNKSYHLRWNNHLANLRALFECMFNEQYLVDVTIVCQDGQLRAHNLILSACSPFFETIFQENPCRHPTVIMRDVTLKEMQSLCQYMYVGSVEVQESSLSSLLNVARDLQIKGLSEKTVYPIKNECTDGDSKFEMMTNDMKVGNKSYHLRWNNHLANLRALFECMFNEQYLVDVTIVCQDGQLRAHNLILSACSPFFETIFQENPCRHPTVIMRDVTLKEMQSLCQYMYVGSVEVQESSLSSLLNVARDLQIKGLSEKTVYPIKNECTDGDSKFEMMTNDMKVGNKSYHLRWNNHLANLRALFECMFNEQYLVDVTIVCQDGQLRAHNLILSACSPFFETIFQENPCRHPTVIMRDVTLKEMQSLCQYMYVGSVEVQESSLSSLLNVARDLQIKGLSEKTVYPIKNECTDGDSKFEMMTNDMKVGNKSYHLRWNNHLANLRALFECMFNEQYLVDVTIVCQDGQLRAHNLILSACSPFFETIFQENPCRHPTVIMRDVTLKEMQSLCQYMYVGSVEVQESSLSSLLNVARDLQIKGLSEKTVYPIKNECTDGDSKFEMMTNDMKVGNKSYHLRWNNHLANLRALFECMFNEQYLVDVTIVCQDGQLRAHNLILSACSPFFETIFQENPCRHPTVIMRDVTLKEMQSLCQYMYVGSVEVQESSLSSLLNVARDLQIKGLSEKTVYPIKNECTDGDSKFEMMTNDMKVGNKSYHLRWNNHLANLRALFECMFNEQYLVDVTIVCQDGQLRAHNLILSACSPFFETIFQENPCRHPTVIMRDVTLKEMQSLCQYMYVGSVEVQESSLSSLLNVARDLQIKGLSEKTVYPIKNECTDGDSKFEMNGGSAEGADQVPDEDDSSDNNASFENASILSPQEMMEEHGNENGGGRPVVSDPDAALVHQSQMADFQAVIGAQSNEAVAMAGVPVECPTCQRTFLNKRYLRRHMQTHSGLKPHQCTYCNLSFLRLSELQRHHRTHTGERPYMCTECPKSFSRSDKLRYHIMQQHAHAKT